MNANSARREKAMYRLYYRLMDICLVGFALAVVLNTIDFFLPDDLDGWANVARFLLRVSTGVLSYFLGAFLMLAWFMRDEYAELLWQRTAKVMVYFVTIAPFVLFTAGWLTHAAVDLMGGDPEPFGFLKASASAAAIIFLGFGVFVFAFVSVFQFLRWRDSL